MLEEAGIEPRPQQDAEATWAPKLTREEERIDWKAPAESVARRIRAFDPSPGAWTQCRKKAIKVFNVRVVGDGGQKPGAVLAAGEVLRIQCGAGAIEVCEVQPAGKARMAVRDFVNGRGVATGDVLA
jgi:methionyl-tRNA formyltransferase